MRFLAAAEEGKLRREDRRGESVAGKPKAARPRRFWQACPAPAAATPLIAPACPQRYLTQLLARLHDTPAERTGAMAARPVESEDEPMPMPV